VFLAELAYQVTTCAPILAVIQVFIWWELNPKTTSEEMGDISSILQLQG
jgi:hypothetical protein